GAANAAFDVVSGSASAGADELESVLAPIPAAASAGTPAPPQPAVRFFRACVPEELQGEALAPFFAQMGWRVDKIALIVESDTAYGKSFAELPAPLFGDLPKGITVLQVPSHVSAVRNA